MAAAKRAKQITVFDPERRELSFSFRLREINKLFAQGFAKDLRRFGITVGQWQFLRALWEYDGSYQQELSSMLGLTSAATVASINLLERDGLAVRKPDPTDNRRLLIVLTAKGSDLRHELLPLAEKHLYEAVEGFSEADLRRFDRFLTKMTHNLIRASTRRDFKNKDFSEEKLR